MMLLRRGCAIWRCTTPSIVSSFMPSRRACANASSRSGPWVPFVPARASAWQLPHVPSPMKSSFPFTRSGGSSRPQAASGQRRERGDATRRTCRPRGASAGIQSKRLGRRIDRAESRPARPAPPRSPLRPRSPSRSARAPAPTAPRTRRRRRASSSVSQRTSFSAISRTAPGPRSNSSSGPQVLVDAPRAGSR